MSDRQRCRCYSGHLQVLQLLVRPMISLRLALERLVENGTPGWPFLMPPHTGAFTDYMH